MARTMNSDDLATFINDFNAQKRTDRAVPFVELPESIELAERVRPFTRIAVKYFALVAEGTVPPLDTSKLAHYRTDSELLRMSVNPAYARKGAFVTTVLQQIDDINAGMDGADITRILRIFPLLLKLNGGHNV
ncbi:hypothetical protein ACFPYJ_17665 [Paenibacillus solisilvae]|uniref:Uncharacterized protein n=1 Tax=Paenibacillus solisilvae TaxID=2486751 RepID=A0ABW0VYE0_9BACL